MKAEEGGINIEGVTIVRSPRGRLLLKHILNIQLDSQNCRLTIESKYVALARLWFATITGLNLFIPNDLFNDHVRKILYENGSISLETRSSAQAGTWFRAFKKGAEKVLKKLGFDGSSVRRIPSRWINIDNVLGIIDCREPEFALRRIRKRQSSWASLFLERIEAPIRTNRLFISEGATVLDSRIIVHTGTAHQSRAIAIEEDDR
jgi:hypothetical protein